MNVEVTTTEDTYSFGKVDRIKFEEEGGVTWLKVQEKKNPDPNSFQITTLSAFQVQYVVDYTPV